MEPEDRIEKWSESVYYLVSAVCAAATVYVACEMAGMKLGDRVKRWRRQADWKLKQEQFDFFYKNIWPTIRRQRHAGQSDE